MIINEENRITVDRGGERIEPKKARNLFDFGLFHSSTDRNTRLTGVIRAGNLHQKVYPQLADILFIEFYY